MKVVCVFGTRPEAIKMLPLVKVMERDPYFEVLVLNTGQHKEMLDQVLDLFDYKPKYNLEIMNKTSSVEDVVSTALGEISHILKKELPDLVLVHGDTATTLAASLASFFQKVTLGHVEAGLRTRNLNSPWPEEGNRQIVSRIANLHFAPTSTNKDNLILEGFNEQDIYVVGNTVIDALHTIVNRKETEELFYNFFQNNYPNIKLKNRIILVTGHRRENFGHGIEQICFSLKSIALRNPSVEIIYPVHLNPNVQNPVGSILSNLRNVHLIEPLDYQIFCKLMSVAHLILTDSGGIQEEAPSLNTPVLLMRDTTERPEGIEAGTVRLVGANAEGIVKETEKLLKHTLEYADMSSKQNPFGDGKTSEKITEILKMKLGVKL